jgi:acyl-CoA thioester hydrolase
MIGRIHHAPSLLASIGTRSNGPRSALAMGRSYCTRPVLLSRSDYRHFETRQTRWNDADAFGHVNNAIYYFFFDDAVNAHLNTNGFGYDYPRFVAESSCRYIRPLTYPAPVDVGLRVGKLGRSSVSYVLGLFAPNEDTPSAQGTFVHVYVNAEGKPIPIDASVRGVLSALE